MKIDNVVVDQSGMFSENTHSYKVSSTPLMMKLLSDNIYTQKELAIIRELSCNALDAHRSNGKEAVPFDIYLDNYEFKIRDYGPGLSKDDLIDMYTTYGDSTKTESNAYHGFMGLGSKCPYCLVDKFITISYHKGKKLTAINGKDFNKVPYLSLISEEDTTEPDGLEISFKLPSYSRDIKYAFNKTIRSFFKFWDVKPKYYFNNVLNKIQEIKKTFEVSNGFFSDETSYSYDARQVNVLIDNVVYSVPTSNIKESLRRKITHRLYLKAPIGDLQVSVNREELQQTRHNSNLINTYIENFIYRAKTKLEKESKELSLIDFYLKYGEIKLVIGDYIKNIITIVSSLPHYNYYTKKEERSIRWSIDWVLSFNNKQTCILKENLGRGIKKTIKYICNRDDINLVLVKPEALDQFLDTFKKIGISNIKIYDAASEYALIKKKRKKVDCSIKKAFPLCHGGYIRNRNNRFYLTPISDLNTSNDEKIIYLPARRYSINEEDKKLLETYFKKLPRKEAELFKVYGVNRSALDLVLKLDNWVHLNDYIKENKLDYIIYNLEKEDVNLLTKVYDIQSRGFIFYCSENSYSFIQDHSLYKKFAILFEENQKIFLGLLKNTNKYFTNPSEFEQFNIVKKELPEKVKEIIEKNREAFLALDILEDIRMGSSWSKKIKFVLKAYENK